MKTITVVFYDRQFAGDWRYAFDEEALPAFFSGLNQELQGCGVAFDYQFERCITMRINGYGDLLNSIRIRSLEDGFSSLCLSQVVGASQDANLLADIKRGVRRVAFSPESIVPQDSAQVCHNCGCGC
ncbi:MAG: hypothetical protein JXR59_07655 [Desulfuromonadaceae bacterium]|nr:hypothetical protein [Desulfuromonadaceae bacterium]